MMKPFTYLVIVNYFPPILFIVSPFSFSLLLGWNLSWFARNKVWYLLIVSSNQCSKKWSRSPIQKYV